MAFDRRTTSMQHLLLVRRALDITQCNDLISLQTLLCISTFLISTSRVVAAHPYIGVACSAVLRLGIYSRSFESLPLTDEQRHIRKRALVVTLKLDVYCSLVLGLPPFIDSRDLQNYITLLNCDISSNIYVLETNKNDDSISLELSYKHLELLEMTASGLNEIFSQLPATSETQGGHCGFPVNIIFLEELGDHFQAWAKKTSSLLQQLVAAPKYDV